MKKTSSFTYVFVGLSGLIHAGIFIGLSLYAIPEMMSDSEDETLTIEIQSADLEPEPQPVVEAKAKPVIKKKEPAPTKLPEKKAIDTSAEAESVDLVPVSQMPETEKEKIRKAVEEDIAQDLAEQELFDSEDPLPEEVDTPEESEPNDEQISAAEPEPTPVVEEQVEASAPEKGEDTIKDVKEFRQSAGNQPPTYPKEARLSGKQGTTLLKYFVTDKGEVTQITIVKSSGHKVLDKAAKAAVKAYRFMPGQAGSALHPVKFSLVGDTERELGRLRTRAAAN